MEKPVFDNSFSVEDMRKLREYNYERTKDFAPDELIEKIREKSQKGIERLKELRNEEKAI